MIKSPRKTGAQTRNFIVKQKNETHTGGGTGLVWTWESECGIAVQFPKMNPQERQTFFFLYVSSAHQSFHTGQRQKTGENKVHK